MGEAIPIAMLLFLPGLACDARIYAPQLAAFAESRGAFLAVSRRQASTEHPYSLSPESLRQLPDGSAIVLPSPNGATLSSIAAEFDASVFTGCLRNASSVASACREIGGPTLVIAAGERWGEQTIRRVEIQVLCIRA